VPAATRMRFTAKLHRNLELSMFSFDEIRTALDNEEFFLEYIPTISLADNRCVGGEALVRWQRGNEVIYPMEFISCIENTPISGTLTYWVMDNVAKELRDWMLKRDAIRISINVPPEIFGRGALQYVGRASGLADVADKLVIEVTERGILDALGVDGVQRMVKKTKVLIAVDDVSENDASLLVLSRIPADIVKLDKSFADQMLRPDWSDQKIAGISALVRNGELCIVAEGVETARQAEILADAGIQYAQGWYFSRSLRAPDFIRYFCEHR